jgi:hypothetical protein
MITLPTPQIQNPDLPRRPLDPQRRRSYKSAFATSTSPSIFLAAYRRKQLDKEPATIVREPDATMPAGA